RNTEQDFYQVDGLGSTRALADEKGNVTDTYDYEAFGELIDSTGESENSYRFTGEQFDEDLGDYYLRQRFYDQSTGRFLRRDTYEGSRNEPNSLHKYMYASGKPVNLIDPTGLFSMAEVSAANAIRNALSGIQIDNGQHLVAVTLGERPDPSDFVVQGLLGLGILASVPLITRFARNTFAMRALIHRYKFFASSNQSTEHFVRHGDEVMQVLGRASYSIQDYIEDANSVIKTGTWVPEMNGYVQVVGGAGRAKVAFVGVRRDNVDIITTFHLKSVREVIKKAPSLGWG
ncbi:MAG: RHS repeat-associated core domain-containing protein, partial [Cyanothece sp. SIO2G6]|nr:RHS repeat-associated core domain-containing protein [Cyanothece sp. SIO2G6]